MLRFLTRTKEIQSEQSSENFGYRLDFLDEMQATLIKEFGREHFEKGLHGFPPSLIELLIHYVNILNKDLDKNYQKEWDNYLRICLAGTEKADKHKPIIPSYYDIDFDLLEKFLANYGFGLEWVDFNSPKDYDFNF